MSALDFPTSPSDGDTYEGYVYNAAKGVWQWQTLTPSLVSLTDTTISSPSSGEVLEYDGTNWVNAAGGGKILQIVEATSATTASTTSTSFTDVPSLSITITPTLVTSKIIVVANFLAYIISSLSTVNDARGAYDLTDSLNNSIIGAGSSVLTFGARRIQRTDVSSYVSTTATLIGSEVPAVTTAVTYKLRFATGFANTSANVGGEPAAQLIAIEVAA